METNETYLELMLGDVSGVYYLAAFTFCIIGMLITMMIDLQVTVDRSKKQGNKINPTIRFWFNDNWFRLLSNFIISPLIIFTVFRFGSDIGIEVKMLLGFACGAFVDSVIIMYRRRLKDKLMRIFGIKKEEGQKCDVVTNFEGKKNQDGAE